MEITRRPVFQWEQEDLSLSLIFRSLVFSNVGPQAVELGEMKRDNI